MQAFFKLRVVLPLTLTAATISAASAAAPADSAYISDPQTSYVQDATSDSIGQVNMLSCIMHSMRPDALVNQGPYVALIDKNKCDASKSSSGASSTDASASQAPEYMTAVVDSARASNSDPMLVKAWISFSEEGKAITVYAHISATEAPSTANPYGAFRLDYCGILDGTQSCSLNGVMQGGSGALSYYEADDHGNGTEVTALQLTSVGTTSGSGSINLLQGSDGNGGTSTFAYNFAYDPNYFLRADSQNGSQCFSRDATDPDTGLSVWQYGLYDPDSGARVERNAGFPVQYTSGGTTYQGYTGYYGLSSQAGAPAPVSGSTIQKVDYANGSATTTNYVVVTNGGRLTRYTRQTRTLQSIDKIHFNAFVNDAATLGLPDNNTQYEMFWDDASGRFMVVGEMRCDQNGCQLSTFPQAQAIDPALWVSSGGVQGYSQSLGGDLFVNLAGLTGSVDSTNTQVVYHVQDLVYPDDSTLPATLYCANNCPTAASLQAFLVQGQGTSPYLTGTDNNFSPVSAANLTVYSTAHAVLTDSASQPVIDTNSDHYQSAQLYQNGVMSGRLFANLSEAVCPDNATPADYCDYQVNSASVYYVWQTGPGSFNQFAAIQDSSGSFVHFDAPLNVNFQVPTGARYGGYAGTSIILQYSGFGDLFGIPGSCVSANTNVPVDCGTQDSRYVPLFVIPYDPSATTHQGIVTTTSSTGTSSYLVKWLQREIRFAVKSPGVCATANLVAPTNVQLPTSAMLKDPSNSSSDVYLGTRPTLTAAPRVIQGEVKY
jgi:hypothetical protein